MHLLKQHKNWKVRPHTWQRVKINILSSNISYFNLFSGETTDPLDHKHVKPSKYKQNKY